MHNILLDFNTRALEIESYFTFLESLITQKIKLAQFMEDGTQQIKSVDVELAKTLKANGFLLLYNLAESTMRNAVEAIFEELNTNEISFDDLKPEIKKIILKNLKKRSPDNIYSEISRISIDIIVVSFNRDELFSGNVDAREIKKIAKNYGFSSDTNYDTTKHGENLLKVKSNRNDLAHGFRSFEKVGRDYTIEELIEIKQEVIKYLEQILNNIQDYLNNQEYLESTASSP
ncbi:MAG: hypothetical protein J7647_06215 [Cyanobacteria bacterium SBLK]|nr:hypothetical protein [Cyanobacteria bacterium SBLK]